MSGYTQVPQWRSMDGQSIGGDSNLSLGKWPGIHESTSNSSFLPPKEIRPVVKSRQRRAWTQIGASTVMGLLQLLPLAIYTPVVLFSTHPEANRLRPIDLCYDQSSSTWGFFEPTSLVGNFTLGQAKAIDLAWNIVIGRGLQFLMSWFSYGIVMQGLTRITENTPMRLDLFISLVYNTSDFSTLGPVCKALFVELKGWRSKFAMAWLIYSIILLLVMPSLVDASTGYANASGLIWYDGKSINGTYYAPYERLPQEYRDSDKAHKCIPDPSYRWGITIPWFLIIYPFYSIWVFGMYVMWMDAQHNSKMTRNGLRVGEWKALVDLTALLGPELGPHTSQYSDKELEKVLGNKYFVKYDVESDKIGVQDARLRSHQRRSAYIA